MIKLLLLIVVCAALFFSNPGLKDFQAHVAERVKEEESATRAGWSAISRITGINALTRAAGLGNYQMCRKDFLLFSLYRITSDKLTDSSTPLAVGLGAASRVFVKRIDLERLEGKESVIGTRIAPEFGKMEFGECIKVHKAGDMTGG